MRVSNPALSWSSQCVLGCHVSSSSHTQWNIDPFYSIDLYQHPLPVSLPELQNHSRGLRMGFSATGTMIMLVLSLGMLKEDVTTAVGLSGKGKPDWDGVEKLLKNISSSQHSGETNVKCVVKVILSQYCYKAFHAIPIAIMHYVQRHALCMKQTNIQTFKHANIHTRKLSNM